MRHRGSLAIATVGLLVAGVVGGCGGGGGGQFAGLSGFYKGAVEGAHTGTIKYRRRHLCVQRDKAKRRQRDIPHLICRDWVDREPDRSTGIRMASATGIS